MSFVIYGAHHYKDSPPISIKIKDLDINFPDESFSTGFNHDKESKTNMKNDFNYKKNEDDQNLKGNDVILNGSKISGKIINNNLESKTNTLIEKKETNLDVGNQESSVKSFSENQLNQNQNENQNIEKLNEFKIIQEENEINKKKLKNLTNQPEIEGEKSMSITSEELKSTKILEDKKQDLLIMKKSEENDYKNINIEQTNNNEENSKNFLNKDKSIPIFLDKTSAANKNLSSDFIIFPTKFPGSNLSHLFFNEFFNPSTGLERKKEMILMPIPLSVGILQFKINRKTEMFHGTKYELFTFDQKKFILKSKKKSFNKTANYMISLDQTNLSDNNSSYLGKLRSNFLGTRFNLYDKGKNPKVTSNEKEMRSQFGCILYEDDVLGTKGPRKMEVTIPKLDSQGKPYVIKPKKKEENFSKICKTGPVNKIYIFYNKTPIWNEEKKTFGLHFKGKAPQPSVRNFQIAENNDSDYIMLQLGKENENTFNLDACFPFSIFQAFSVAISALDLKIAVE